VPPRLPFRPVPAVEVFAVDTSSVQVTWRGAPDGPVVVRIADRQSTAASTAGAGVVELGGLEADTDHRVEVTTPERTWRLRARTLALPSGPRLARVATVSDLHMGEERFGLLFGLTDDPAHSEPHTLRCARAAVVEAVAWGAELLVVKGDLTHAGKPEQWEMLDRFLAGIPIPVLLMVGNHDDHPRGIGAAAALADRGHERAPVRVHDHGGIRILLVDTSRPGRGRGAIGEETAAVAARHAAAWDGPLLVCTHHHLERLPFTWFWPPGVRKREADHFLTMLAGANGRALVTSGHTHRHRLHRRAVPVSEVGSPKDFPGVWAGYDLHEDAVVQVVRRVADPACLPWTESCRRAAGGWWGRWSPGTLDQRCFTLPLATGPVAAGAVTAAGGQSAGRTS
jgi:3',5'-cyclic-AMP phosphodiesterase